MILRELFDRAGFWLSAPKCVCCSERLSYGERALCPKCYGELLGNMTRNCSRCSKLLSRCTCSNEYLEEHKIKSVIKVFRYLRREENRASSTLIFSLKKDNRRDVLELCSDMLFDAAYSNLIEGNIIKRKEDVIITNVPRRRKAYIDFGIDHSRLLAEQLAKRLGCEYRSLFASKAKKPQKLLRTDARRKNAVFKIKSKADLRGKTIIIVDDVITSGASMGAVAILARSMGARRIIAACLGIVYRDKFTPPVFTFN